MKIALRGGHTKKSTGAKVLIDEVTEDRKVYQSIMKYLKQEGVNVIDVTPPDTMSYPSELNYGINKANDNNVDLFVSIHFNNVYSTEKNTAIGSEVWVYKDKFDYAKRVQSKLVSLGFKDRGVKSMVEHNGVKLGELINTKMKAMIVEVCFVESRVDCDLYKKHGYDLIGKRIAEGLLNKTIVQSPVLPTKKFKIVCENLTETNAKKGVELLKNNLGLSASVKEM